MIQFVVRFTECTEEKTCDAQLTVKSCLILLSLIEIDV